MVAVAASYEEGDGGGGIEEGSGGATGEGRREMQTRVNGKGCEKERDVEAPSQPKIFPLPPITSNLSTYAWSIKCR
jgi:hypothetical protein